MRALEVVERQLRAQDKPNLIYFAGDSSLDNKFWFENRARATNGYEHILRPPESKVDVAYHVNKLLEARNPRWACVNTAVEATSLNDRAFGRLLEQDRFLRDSVRETDAVVISVGGNDIALAPLLCTCCNVAPLLCIGGLCGDAIDRCACACPPDVYTPCGGATDCGCCLCGLPGCLTGLCGFPPGLGYFVDLFGNRVRAYAANLVAKKKPRVVVVCMIYYLDVNGRGSWADATLQLLGYNYAPGVLQRGIRQVYRNGTKRIRLNGVPVVALPLFEILDGSDTRDYVQRVEPSPTGGAKLAKAIVDAVLDATDAEDRSRNPITTKEQSTTQRDTAHSTPASSPGTAPGPAAPPRSGPGARRPPTKRRRGGRRGGCTPCGETTCRRASAGAAGPSRRATERRPGGGHRRARRAHRPNRQRPGPRRRPGGPA